MNVSQNSRSVSWISLLNFSPRFCSEYVFWIFVKYFKFFALRQALESILPDLIYNILLMIVFDYDWPYIEAGSTCLD